MTGRKKALLAGVGALLMSQVCPVGQADAKQVMVDAKMLEQLQQLVMAQQKQLDSLVITSYSIHYTKLYDSAAGHGSAEAAGQPAAAGE